MIGRRFIHSKKSVKIGHNILYNLKEFSVFIFYRCFTSNLNFTLVCNELPVLFLLFYIFIFYSVQMDNDPKHTAKTTQEFLKSEIFCNGKVNLLISTRLSCISLAEDKTNSRKTHKQTTTEVSCSKGLAKHHKGGNPVSGDVHEIQT